MNILFITSTRIGDAVLTTGLLAHLVETYPESRITLACGPTAAPLFAAAPNVVRRIVLVKRKGSLHWFDLWRACVTTRWDLIVDLRSTPLIYLLPARDRRTYRRDGAGGHRILSVAKVLGLAAPPAPRVWTTPEHDAEAARLTPSGGPVLALGPTANWRGKTWRAENFVALVERLTAADGILPGARVAVLGAARQRTMAQPVLDAVPDGRLIDLVGRVDLPTAAAALRRCALFIGHDSGLMHLAAAAGTPTLGLFGPSRDEHYAPWGPRAAAVRTEIAYDDLFPRQRHDRATADTLMDSLSVDAVERAAIELWRRCAETGGPAPGAPARAG